MNIAIIGANGFVGSHLVQKLQQLPDTDLVLYGRREESVFGNSLPYRQVDLRNKEHVSEVVAGADIVYHVASETIPAKSWESPMMEIENNLTPFIHLLEHLVAQKVKKFVFVSSAGTVYGTSDHKLTEDSNKSPFSPYGITKLTMEYYLEYFRVKHGLNYDIYRVSNVYGEGQNTGKGLGVINTFLENILSEGKVTIYGTGDIVRNYIYVKDLAEMMSLSASEPLHHHNIFNVASFDTLSINDIVQQVKAVVNTEFEEIRVSGRKSDNPIIDIDNSKIMEKLPGFKFTPIHEGIEKTYKHILNQTTKVI